MQWTAAFVDDLPDSAFFYVKPGGKKVAGKTVPRSLRMFPYRGSDGNVDMAHLRNALGRIPQADIPAAEKARLAAKGEKLLASMDRKAGTKKSMLAGALECVLPGGCDYANPFADVAAGGGDWRSALAKADRPGVVAVLSSPDAETSPREIAQRAFALQKADFLVEYPDGPEARAELAKVGRPFKLPGGDDRLFVASFPLASDDGVAWIDPPEPEMSSITIESVEKSAGLSARVCKMEDEGTILFVVLEPRTADNPDPQGDWYNEAEIQKAMYRYMKDYRNHTFMHAKDAQGRPVPLGEAVRILENYQAPVDFDVGAERVSKGTWLQRIWTDPAGAYFQKFKKGELTGASIGGDAVRRPTIRPAAPAA